MAEGRAMYEYCCGFISCLAWFMVCRAFQWFTQPRNAGSPVITYPGRPGGSIRDRAMASAERK